MIIIAMIQLIYDYQRCHTTRVRPSHLKLYMHWWLWMVSTMVTCAYLSLTYAHEPFVWRLLIFQANALSFELVIYWQWTVFSVARRTGALVLSLHDAY
jgi:hypothetical protein